MVAASECVKVSRERSLNKVRPRQNNPKWTHVLEDWIWNNGSERLRTVVEIKRARELQSEVRAVFRGAGCANTKADRREPRA